MLRKSLEIFFLCLTVTNSFIYANVFINETSTSSFYDDLVTNNNSIDKFNNELYRRLNKLNNFTTTEETLPVKKEFAADIASR